MMPVIFRSTFRIGLVIILVSFIYCKSDKAESHTAEPMIEVKEEEQDTTHSLSYIMGQFDPSSHPLFSEIEVKYADRTGMYMRTEAYLSFQKMWTHATQDGLKLVIRSATRNFDYQKGIWERKWTGQTGLSDGTKATDLSDPTQRALKILLYSSMPGTSRHHWGTDIDLNSFENKWFESGEGLKLYNWMLAHADTYGFCQVYTAKGNHRPHGYEEEKWHWSYKPLSEPLTKYAEANLQDDMIQNFKGAEVTERISVVQKYVLGIDPKCRE